MLKKTSELIGTEEPFDELVENDFPEQPLGKLYFNCKLHLEPIFRRILVARMDNYIQLSRSPKFTKTQEFKELEITVLLDIFYTINERGFCKRDSLATAISALEEYKSLSDKKRALFRKGVGVVPHKRKSPLSIEKQKTIA